MVGGRFVKIESNLKMSDSESIQLLQEAMDRLLSEHSPTWANDAAKAVDKYMDYKLRKKVKEVFLDE